MEADYADQLDLEWHSIFQKHLKNFSSQNQEQTYTFDEILRKLFCPDPTDEQGVRHEDKEICEKCLIEAINILSSRSDVPRQSQIQYLLNIAKYTCKDESCFLNLETHNVLQNLVFIAQASTEVNTKILFMEFFQAFLEHPSGIKRIMETKYWSEIFAMTVCYQNKDDRVTKIGCKFLKVCLEKVNEIDENYCEEITRFLTRPILKISQQAENPYVPVGLKDHLTCLVKILEDLLKSYSASVLLHFINLKIGFTCDLISEKCTDKELCLILDRITLILSFFGLTEFFDGIKCLKQDPLELCGFNKVIEREVNKDNLTVVLDLYYYGLKYVNYVSDKLPKYCQKGERDAEGQIVALQLETIVLEWARVVAATNSIELPKGQAVDISMNSHPFKIFMNLSYETFSICDLVKKNLPKRFFDLSTKAVENIVRSKHLYSKRSVCSILDSLVYSLEAPLKYLQSRKGEKVIMADEHQVYILALLKATFVFIGFNLSWSDSVKSLDLLYIVIEGCSSYPWIEPIVLDSLILLKQIIELRFSPSMALLIDTAEGLKNIGPLLYKTCLTDEWKIRNAVLEVIHVIALSANKCFSSFKTILFDASLPSLVSAMAWNDESVGVRATALKCLQEMVLLDGIEDILPKNVLILKVLDIINSNVNPVITKEAVVLITTLYNIEEYLCREIKTKIYKCLEDLALSNSSTNCVQKEVVSFWRTVARKLLTNEGWMDSFFPTVTFSKKRIISLTETEVTRRCYKVLNELSHVGCLNALSKFYQSVNMSSQDCLHKYVIDSLRRFHYTFSTDKITPESMSINEEILDFPSIHFDSLPTPQQPNDILQDIIRDTMMIVEPDDMGYVNNEVYNMFAMMDTDPKEVASSAVDLGTNTTRRVKPSEFVELVYKKFDELLLIDPDIDEKPMKRNDVYITDF